MTFCLVDCLVVISTSIWGHNPLSSEQRSLIGWCLEDLLPRMQRMADLRMAKDNLSLKSWKVGHQGHEIRSDYVNIFPPTRSVGLISSVAVASASSECDYETEYETQQTPEGTEEQTEVTITVESRRPSKKININRIRLSCESDVYNNEQNYVGIILYGWINSEGQVQTDWRLNGKHCKSGYIVIQNAYDTESYSSEGPVISNVHNAVYWNVFGQGSDTSRAIGEGFSVIAGSYIPKYDVFAECIHCDAESSVVTMAEKCARGIVNDWMRGGYPGKTYRVKDLLC